MDLEVSYDGLRLDSARSKFEEHKQKLAQVGSLGPIHCSIFCGEITMVSLNIINRADSAMKSDQGFRG